MTKEKKKKLLDVLKKSIENEYIKEIVWNQYTPYFNDGSDCRFGVDEIRFRFFSDFEKNNKSFLKKHFWCYEYNENNQNLSFTPKFIHKKEYDVTNEQNSILQAVEIFEKEYGEFIKNNKDYEDIFLDLFGDHVEITFDGQNFQIEGYNHD